MSRPFTLATARRLAVVFGGGGVPSPGPTRAASPETSLRAARRRGRSENSARAVRPSSPPALRGADRLARPPRWPAPKPGLGGLPYRGTTPPVPEDSRPPPAPPRADAHALRSPGRRSDCAPAAPARLDRRPP